MIIQRQALYCLKRARVPLERVVIKRDSVKEKKCTCCGEAKETMEHVLIEYGDIHPAVRLGTRLHEALGFRDNNGKLNTSAVDISKRRLEYWWQKSREK